MGTTFLWLESKVELENTGLKKMCGINEVMNNTKFQVLECSSVVEGLHSMLEAL